MTDDAPFDDHSETSGIEFDAYGFKGKINPASRQADEPANWWGVLTQLNQLLMDFVVNVPGVIVDTVKGLRNLARALGGVRIVPRDVTQIAEDAREEAARRETELGSHISTPEVTDLDDDRSGEAIIQLLREMQADGLHVEIIERPDGAIVLVIVRPDAEWQENARKVAGYVAGPDEVLMKSLHEIGLPARIIQRLEEADLFSVGDLVCAKDEELLKIPGIGSKSLEMIRHCLRRFGL